MKAMALLVSESSRGAKTPRDPADGLTLSRSIARIRQGARCRRLRNAILQLGGPSPSARLGMTRVVA
jgi:hypothetical protein